MIDQSGGYDTYLNALKELDTVRAAEQSAFEAHQHRVTSVSTSMESLWQRLTVQRGRLAQLAADCGLPAPPANPVGTTAVTDPAAAVAAAATDVAAADAGYADSRYLAHRAKLLPRWRADDRNGLIYGGFGLAGLLVQVVVLASAAGTERLAEATGQLLICLLVPFVAFAAGWLTIGVVSRPILGAEKTEAKDKLPRNPRLGLAICLSAWLVACSLGNLYLNF